MMHIPIWRGEGWKVDVSVVAMGILVIIVEVVAIGMVLEGEMTK